MTDPIQVVVAVAVVLVTAAVGYLIGRSAGLNGARVAEGRAAELDGELRRAARRNQVLEHKLIRVENDAFAAKQEVDTLNLYLDGVEVMRSDFKRLKVRGSEADRLREEVEELRTELSEQQAHVQDDELVPLGEDLVARESARSLEEAVAALIDGETTAATIVDDAGFAIVSAGSADDALAAYSVLLGEASGRATAFVPIGNPYVMTLVDGGGARVSYWPFTIGERELALLTLSHHQPSLSAVNAAISKVKVLLPKSFRSLGAGV